MNTLRSFTETVVTTPTDTFPISFEYDEKYDAVHVFLNDVAVKDLGYTVSQVNAVTLKIEPAIPEGTVRIERETDIDKMKYIFDAGALFIDQNVDADFRQIVHSQQEVRDGFIKLRGDVLPLVHGLQEALQQAQEASEAAQEAANAAEVAASQTQYYLKYFNPEIVYPKNARIMLDNGDIVRSTVANNTSNPNNDMAGWVNVEADQELINTSANSVNALVAGLLLDGTDETTSVTAILNSGKIIEVPKNKTLTVDTSVFAGKQDKYWGEGFVKVVGSTDLSYLKPQPLPPYPNGYRQGYFESLQAGGNKSTAVGHGVVVNRVGYPEISGYRNSSEMASYGSGDVVGSYVDVRAPMATTLTGTTFTANNVVATSLTSAANIRVGDTIRTATDSAQGNAVWLGWVTAVDFDTKTITVDGWYKRYTTTAGTPTSGINVITPDVTSVFGQHIVVFGKTGDSAEIFRGSEIGILIDTSKPTPRLIEGMLMLNMNSSVQGGSCYAAGGYWKVGYRADNSIVGFQHLGSSSVDGYTGLVHQSVYGKKSNILKGMANDGVTTFYTMDMYGKQSHERVIATTLTGGDKTLSWGDGSFYIVDSSTTRKITINPNPVYSIGTIWEFIIVGSKTVTITAGTTTTVLNDTVNGYNRMRIYYDGSFRVLELCRTVGSLGYANTFSEVQTFSSGVKVGTASYLNGTGSPEGVVTAPVGSLYTRTDGGAGTTLYVKESGTGNTGWVAK